MQTWAIIAQKGGQSKTTIATAFAVKAAREGAAVVILDADDRQGSALYRTEEHTSELQSLMSISSAVLCLKKIKNMTINSATIIPIISKQPILTTTHYGVR